MGRLTLNEETGQHVDEVTGDAYILDENTGYYQHTDTGLSYDEDVNLVVTSIEDAQVAYRLGYITREAANRHVSNFRSEEEYENLLKEVAEREKNKPVPTVEDDDPFPENETEHLPAPEKE